MKEANDYQMLFPIKNWRNKWGYEDKYGNKVIPCKYDEVCSFDEGVARVKLKNKWGLINKLGG